MPVSLPRWSRVGHRLAPVAGLAGRAVDPTDNPFLAAELRIQARRRVLPRSLLLHALALGFLFLLLLWMAHLPASAEEVRPQRWLTLHLITGIAALHGWLIVHASTSRVREAALREETAPGTRAAGGWEMLLVTPLSATEIVLFKSVYPFLYSSLIALVALPIYVLAAAISGVSFARLLMLYGVYALVMVRLVTLPRPVSSRRARRSPRRAASSSGSPLLWLWVWLWLLTWAGLVLIPLEPLSGAMFLTWPVVAAKILPTPYPFFRFSLPPVAALLALGPPWFILHLRSAARRLDARITNLPAPAPAGRLRSGLILGTVVVVVGYAWPRMVEGGRLGTWLGFGPTPGDSIRALGWLLLGLWWLVPGVGGLLNLPERPAAVGTRAPGLWGGRLGGTDTGVPAGVAALLAPPLLLLALACVLSWRLPPPSAIAWLGRTVLVAAGAGTLTVVLARRVQAATRAGGMRSVSAAWLWVGLLLAAPLALLDRQDPLALRVAALSPVVGFLALLPRASLAFFGLGPLPPWWLGPMLNAGTALLLAGLRPTSASETPAAAPARRSAALPKRRFTEGPASHWVERLAAWYDEPVLIKELRVRARRNRGFDGLRRISLGAAMVVIALLPPIALLYGTSLGDEAPGGIPLRAYLSIVTGLASAIPLRLFPGDLSGFRLFFASVLALLLLALGSCIVFSAPPTGAATFSEERRKGTLGFLLLTPLRETEIVRGKLLGAAAPLLLTIAGTFPPAAAAALLALSPAVLWTLLFSFTWLLIACFTGVAFGTLTSLLLPAASDPAGPPLLAMLLLQALKLYAAARLQFLLTSGASGKLEITAWFVVPLVLMEAALGLLAYAASVALLARSRHRELSFVTEK